jgi:NCAIR mutase (PurE)-related protein
MDANRMRALLAAVRAGELSIDDALERFAQLPFVAGEHARVDTHRALRQGMPEVVFGLGKTPEQIASIVRTLRSAGQDGLVTRIERAAAREVLAREPGGDYDDGARVLWYGPSDVAITGAGTIAVVCAGTADLPVAREAEVVARRLGNKVELIADVGVAGLHRLLAASEALRAANVLIAIAGMEGALPSVVGGLVARPVIAVPTSVGYGASYGGLAALLGMMSSCASNVSVVNIDNGFGAAVVASLINRG